jgi:ectoine hydroxylase-related dioxygenase (phytanoyl-CoA dioxygenase family)
VILARAFTSYISNPDEVNAFDHADEWLATGPTTRTAIRTFFVVAKKSRLNTHVSIQHRSAKTSPALSQDQRLAWIHELLTGTSESLPYRWPGCSCFSTPSRWSGS